METATIIKEEKRCRKRLENTWRKEKTRENRESYTHQKNHVNYIIDSARTNFYRSKIEEYSGDQKALFKMIRSLCGQDQDSPLPPHECVATLAEDFGNFFIQKIEDIRTKLDTNSQVLT